MTEERLTQILFEKLGDEEGCGHPSARSIAQFLLKKVDIVVTTKCPSCGSSPMQHGFCGKCNKYCGCSFSPTSKNDYCDAHRE